MTDIISSRDIRAASAYELALSAQWGGDYHGITYVLPTSGTIADITFQFDEAVLPADAQAAVDAMGALSASGAASILPSTDTPITCDDTAIAGDAALDIFVYWLETKPTFEPDVIDIATVNLGVADYVFNSPLLGWHLVEFRRQGNPESAYHFIEVTNA